MWRVSLVLLLSLGVTGVLTFDRSLARQKLIDYRVRSQNLHVDHLEEQVEKLEEQYDALGGHITQLDVAGIQAHVRRNERTKCREGEASCGGDFPECISQLFFCDGRVDCHNGMDEDENVCSAEMIYVGSTFRGVPSWDACEKRLAAELAIAIITAVYHPPVSTNHIYVRVHYVTDTGKLNDSHAVQEFDCKGYYNFATRQLVLGPDSDAPAGKHTYGVTWSFHFGDDRHAACDVFHYIPLDHCGKNLVVKV